MTNFNHAQFIRDTIGGQIPEQYRAHVQRLAHAYEDRDTEAIRVIREEARRAGLAQEEADRVLERAGLLVAEPVNAARAAQPQAQVPGEDDLHAVVGRLAGTVDRLVEAARRNGINVS